MTRKPHNFAAGFQWFRSAFRLLRENAIRLFLLGLLFQLLAGASQMGIFGLLFFLALPALTAGLLEGVHQSAQGRRPSALALFAAFQQPGRVLPLFLLGGLTIAMVMVVVGVVVAPSIAQLDPELAGRIQSGDQSAVLELDPVLTQKVLFAVLAGLLMGTCLSFFAVPLIWFNGLGLGGALGRGLMALLRQWRALTALGLLLVAIGLPVGVFVGAITASQMGATNPSLLLTSLLMIVMVAYQMLGLAAQYFAWRDVFGGDAVPPREGSDGAEDENRDDQLVA